MKGIYILALLLLFISGLQAQNEGFYPEQDTVLDVDPADIPKIKARIFAGRPGKAALFSLILPGAGQAYNKQYWQVPLVWAGVGAAGYYMNFNITEYNKHRDAYRQKVLGETVTDPDLAPLSADQIKNLRDQWNNYRQISIFVFAATWIANSAQAYVSAHLKDFDISDDLSMEIVPFAQPNPMTGSFPVSGSIILKF